MLHDEDEKDAIKLYINFKKIMEESEIDADKHTQDFILKNIMFGIFENNILAGFVIIQYSRKFKIDNGELVDTFYIQELLIDEKFTKKKYGELLIKYCILRCPIDKLYISFMTMPTNKGMIKIANKLGFILQEAKSGDKKHSLLFIKINDKLEKSLYIDLTKKAKSSSSSK